MIQPLDGSPKAGPMPPATTDLAVLSMAPMAWTAGYEHALVGVRKALDAGVPVRYRVAASGKDRTRLAYTIFDLDLGHHVELSDAGVEDLDRSNVYLSTSFAPDPGVAGALTRGLVVIATVAGAGAIATAVGAGSVRPLLIPPRDADAVAAALMQVHRELTTGTRPR